MSVLHTSSTPYPLRHQLLKWEVTQWGYEVISFIPSIFIYIKMSLKQYDERVNVWLLQTRETNYLLNCLLFEQQLSHVHLYKGPSDSSSQGLLSCLWLLLSFLDNKEERIWTITKSKKEKKNLSFLRCQSCKNSEAFVTVKTKWFVEYIILKLSREGNGRTKRLSQQRISHFFFIHCAENSNQYQRGCIY